MADVDVALAGRSYRVKVGPGLLERVHADAHSFIEPYGKRAVPVVADANAKRLHGERLQASFRSAGHSIDWYEVAPGESSKSWDELVRLTDWLLDRGVTRSDHVFALGGGVVGDLVGFACAIMLGELT